MSENEQKNSKNNSNETDDDGGSEGNTPNNQIRNEKGQFGPKKTDKISPKSTPEPAEPTNEGTKDLLLDQIESDFREDLKSHPILNELDGLNQRLRIRMLRAVAKSQGKKKETVDPTKSTPPQEQHIPTLLEMNKAHEYRRDMQKQNSYLNIANKLRKRG